MKLDIDCIRSVLLELESLPLGYYIPEDFAKSVAKHGLENVEYTISKLDEAGYIRASISRTLGGDVEIFSVTDITFNGHQFLEKIRDNQIWQQTKTVAGAVGSKALDVITQIASAVITEIINKRLSGQI